MTIAFPQRPRRGSVDGHMVVQKNVDFLANLLEGLSNRIKRGTATITPPATLVTVTHGLNSTAYSVAVTPTVNPGAAWWVGNKTATTFDINLPAAPAGAVSFDWILRGG